MIDLRILDEAMVEYEEAREWYHQRSEQAATGFEIAVEKALEEVVQCPERWPRCDNENRFYPLGRYPYSVIYRAGPLEIVVAAIAHNRRSWGYWKDRG